METPVRNLVEYLTVMCKVLLVVLKSLPSVSSHLHPSVISYHFLYSHRNGRANIQNLKHNRKKLIKLVYWQNNEIRVFPLLADFALSTSHLLVMIWLFLDLYVKGTLLTTMKGLWLSTTAVTVLILVESFIPVTPNIHLLEANGRLSE